MKRAASTRTPPSAVPAAAGFRDRDRDRHHDRRRCDRRRCGPAQPVFFNPAAIPFTDSSSARARSGSTGRPSFAASRCRLSSDT